MRYMQLATFLVVGVAICAHAMPATAQDQAVNREVLRALKQLRHEVSILKEQNSHLKGEFNKLKQQAKRPTVDVSTAVPLKEISEQRQLINQQASRIDGLEARNASLQDSVDAVINRPPVEAIEFSKCAEPAWLIEAGLINWRARRSSMAYAGALNVQPGGRSPITCEKQSSTATVVFASPSAVATKKTGT